MPGLATLATSTAVNWVNVCPDFVTLITIAAADRTSWQNRNRTISSRSDELAKRKSNDQQPIGRVGKRKSTDQQPIGRVGKRKSTDQQPIGRVGKRKSTDQQPIGRVGAHPVAAFRSRGLMYVDEWGRCSSLIWPRQADEASVKAAVAARSPPAAGELRSRQHGGGAGTNFWAIGDARHRRALFEQGGGGLPRRNAAAEHSPRFGKQSREPKASREPPSPASTTSPETKRLIPRAPEQLRHPTYTRNFFDMTLCHARPRCRDKSITRA
jgi:hypothetical protein